MSPERFEQLTSRAREMRRVSVPAETILWSYLRNRQLGGFKWKRQQPFLAYVLDFYCAELRLVIELDGDSHFEPHSDARDTKRAHEIEAQGLHLIRFINPDVFENIDGVLEAILDTCKRLADPSP